MSNTFFQEGAKAPLWLRACSRAIVFVPSTAEKLLDKLNQARMNHRYFLLIHKHVANQVDLITILQDFKVVNDHRIQFFGKML